MINDYMELKSTQLWKKYGYNGTFGAANNKIMVQDLTL